MRHIVLSPHLDDATLSLGGLLAQKQDTGTVITFFAGSPVPIQRTLWDARCGFEHSDIAMKARLKENEESLRILGVSDVINLSYLDGQYRTSQPTIEELRASLEDILERYSDHEIRLYGPGLEMHADHALIKQLLVACASSRREGFRYFHYQDIPYAVTLAGADGKKISKIAEATQGAKHVINLDQERVKRKCEAISAYRSQLDPLGGEAKLLFDIQTFAETQARLEHADSPYVELVYEI